MSEKKWIGAADLMAKLQANPEWVAANAERQAKREARKSMLDKNQAPILKDILKAGLKINSVWDLVNTGYSYPEAIPVLLDHLQGNYHERIREGIIRALNTSDAKGVASHVILEDLKRETDPNLRFALANTLFSIALPEQADEIRRLLDDPSYKDVHHPLQEALSQLSKQNIS